MKRITWLFLAMATGVGCAGSESSQTCFEGQRRCNSNYVEVCQAGSWLASIDCAANGQPCTNGVCGSDSSADQVQDCQQGATRCTSATSLEYCDNGAYSPMDCNEYCKNGFEQSTYARCETPIGMTSPMCLCGWCGDGYCDVPTEDETSCSTDCKGSQCQSNEVTCQDASTARYCDAGVWQIQDCASYCAQVEPNTEHASCGKDPFYGADMCICSYCGDGFCYLAAENESNCSQDCQGSACQAPDSECQGTDSLRMCDGGAWVTNTCADVCQQGIPQTTFSECDFSPQLGMDICMCHFCGDGYCAPQAGETNASCPSDCQ